MRGLALAALWMMAGCAMGSAGPHHGTGAQPPIPQPQKQEIETLESQQRERSEALNVASAAAECSDVCGHVEAICRLSERICRIADRHRAHQAATDACRRSTKRCQDARDRVASRCQCSGSERKKPSEL